LFLSIGIEGPETLKVSKDLQGLAGRFRPRKGTRDIGPRAEAGLAEAWFHWFDRRPYLQELHGFLGVYRSWLCESVPGGQAIHARLEQITAACQRTLDESPARIERESVPLRLCHVDPNPANAIAAADGRVRWVDWESSGWGDPALDLAEFRWHEALAFLSPQQVAWLRAHYRPPAGDAGFGERLRQWDALLATRWPFLLLRRLWSLANGPDRERLSVPAAREADLQARLLALIERAEIYFQKLCLEQIRMRPGSDQF
jgi:hypothetical protein